MKNTSPISPWLLAAAGGLLVVTFLLGWFIGSFGRWPMMSATYAPGTQGVHGMGGMMGSGSGMMHRMTVASDADFLMQMIPHHQEAVDTSRYVLDRTDDSELQSFLRGIIDAQTREITQMKAWHRDWFGTDYRDDGRYKTMMPNLQGLDDTRLVPAYLHGMVMHHMGAIDMAHQLQGFTKRPELVSFAGEIIRVQTDEIGWMMDWLRDGFGGGAMMMH